MITVPSASSERSDPGHSELSCTVVQDTHAPNHRGPSDFLVGFPSDSDTNERTGTKTEGVNRKPRGERNREQNTTRTRRSAPLCVGRSHKKHETKPWHDPHSTKRSDMIQVHAVGLPVTRNADWSPPAGPWKRYAMTKRTLSTPHGMKRETQKRDTPQE